MGTLFFAQHVTITFTNSYDYSQTHVCLLDFKLRTVVFKIWRKYYILRETRDYILVIFLQLMGFFRFYTVMFLEQLNINITAHFILIHIYVHTYVRTYVCFVFIQIFGDYSIMNSWILVIFTVLEITQP